LMVLRKALRIGAMTSVFESTTRWMRTLSMLESSAL
jgi:hypothetical protein